jgi:hypothetical protein
MPLLPHAVDFDTITNYVLDAQATRSFGKADVKFVAGITSLLAGKGTLRSEDSINGMDPRPSAHPLTAKSCSFHSKAQEASQMTCFSLFGKNWGERSGEFCCCCMVTKLPTAATAGESVCQPQI